MRKSLPAIILGLICVLAARPAGADAVVLSSTAPGMVVGRVLADDEPVHLPEATLTTLLLADGRLLKLNGPMEGRTAELAGGQQTASTAGGGFAGLDVSALGGTRGELAAMPPPPSLDAVTVNTRHPGTWCVARATTVRAGFDGMAEAPGGGPSVPVSAGQPWPPQLPITDGAHYVVRGPAGAVPIAFRVVDAADDVSYAFRLARAGCLAQVAGYLREAGQRTTAFSLYLTTDRGQAPRYAIGEPVTVTMQTNRPARIACSLVKDGVATSLFPQWVEVADHQVLQVPGDHAVNEVAATPPPGVGELRCAAVDDAVADRLPPVERLESLSLPENRVASAHIFIRVQ